MDYSSPYWINDDSDERSQSITPTLRPMNYQCYPSNLAPFGDIRLTEQTPFEDHSLRTDFHAPDQVGRRSKGRSSSVVTNPYDEMILDEQVFRARNRTRSGRLSKDSPTPSMKRGKAEKLLKEHGSPPGIRVTAGGRIVPDGLSPLTSPRFNQNFLNNIWYDQRGQARRDQNYVQQPLAEGQLWRRPDGSWSQLIGGQLRPLKVLNGASQNFRPQAGPLPFSAPYPADHHGNSQAYVPMMSTLDQPLSVNGSFPANEPNSMGRSTDDLLLSERALQMLEQLRDDLEHDLKDLDRNEVLQRNSITPSARAKIVQRRIEITTRLNDARKDLLKTRAALGRSASSCDLKNKKSSQNSIRHSKPTYRQSTSPMASDNTQFLQPNTFVPPEVAPAMYGDLPYPFALHGFQLPLTAPPQSNAAPYPLQDSLLNSSTLQERSGNIVYHNSKNARSDPKIGNTSDGFASFDGNGAGNGMSFDGSSTQPRRSHAVQIKVPHKTSNKGNSSLNPTSPVYEPAHPLSAAGNHQDSTRFVPSPRLVAEMDNLVKSPNQQHHDLHDSSVDGHLPSDSTSASTADFFPQDTYQHSGTRYSFDPRADATSLPTWLPQEETSAEAEPIITPGRSQTPVIWGNPSPNDSDNHDVTSEPHRRSGAYGQHSSRRSEKNCDMDIVALSHFSQITPETKKQQSAHLRESTISMEGEDQNRLGGGSRSAIEALQRSTEQMSLEDTGSTNAEYWSGYKLGLHQDLLTGQTSEEFRLGYRDGLIQSSTFKPSDGPDREKRVPSGRADFANSDHGGSETRQSSLGTLPYLRPNNFQTPPKVPTNSLCTTPTNKQSEAQGSFMNFDSVAEPNSNSQSPTIVSMENRKYPGGRRATQQLAIRDCDADHPIAVSPGVNNKLFAPSSEERKGPTFALRMQNRNVCDQQRYQKSKASVAQSSSPARGWFPSQLDGSGDDDKAQDAVGMSPPSSPALADKGRTKAAQSPVREKASAAMAKMGQLARISAGKKDHDSSPSKKDGVADPSKMSPAEKDKWRTKWKKRFDNLRATEQDEISEYKKKHPLPDVQP